MYLIGLSTMGSSAACLFKDGRLVFAIEEERLSRIKNDGSFPLLSIKECLKYKNLDINDIDTFCIYWKPYNILGRVYGVLKKTLSFNKFAFLMFKISFKSFFLKDKNKKYPELSGSWVQLFFIRKILRKNFSRFKGKIKYFDHHQTHQAYSEAMNISHKDFLSISLDGGGEELSTVVTVVSGNQRKIIKKIPWPNSMGHFYSYFTGFLGFRMLEGEYKMMGLAPLGKPVYKKIIFDNFLKLDRKGGYLFNYNLCDYHAALEDNFSPKVIKLLGKNRNKDEEFNQRHRDIAASVQEVYEDTLEHMLSWAKSRYPNTKNLFLSGGCALNVTANGNIIKKGIFETVYLPPAPHDAGCSIGAVLCYLKNEKKITVDFESIMNPYLGSIYSNEEVKKSFLEMGLEIPELLEDDILIKKTASILKNQGVIAWFQGRSEFGPRALGSRSYLADPRNDNIRYEINKKIKKRELFRPFAPSVLVEKQSEYFSLDLISPYMNIVSDVKSNMANKIPAVVHIDSTARIHSVTKKLNPLYHKLISEFYSITNIPVLLNTSFNIQEPIVNSPKDAIKTFINSRVDSLVIGNYFCDTNWRNRIKKL